jgi:LysM repeat protein
LDLFTWQIYKYNDLPVDTNLTSGQRIYIQPKRRKAEISEKTHIVKEGETMWSISQKYGVKLAILYKKNNLKPGSQVTAGTKLSLRKKVKVKK